MATSRSGGRAWYPSRRRFLKGSAAALGSGIWLRAALAPTAFLASSGGLTACESRSSPDKSPALARFDHLVVLMLENRSFDNMLGYLYEPGEVPRKQRFQGVAGRRLANPIPAAYDVDRRRVVPVTKGYVMTNPAPDPGEGYPHVNTELYGTVIPEENQRKQPLEMAPPFNAPSPLPATAPMNGFVQDYINSYLSSGGSVPSYDQYQVIMNCFPADAVPVISTLARRFAVCDHWYCDVPSQTFCNRSFFNAGTSSGFVLNAPYENFPLYNKAVTIFDRIESARSKGLTWKVYYDQQDFVSLTALLHFSRLRDRFGSNIVPMEQFYDDAWSGRLPSYAFVEPRLFFNHNDEHPPVNGYSSVLAGEVLINEVYDAIRRSDSHLGSNYQNTALVITFDEHGGCYDHVPPPPAAMPDRNVSGTQMGFRFDRLGLRVPAVVVSAYTEPGTVINSPMQGTSIIKTMTERWGLSHITDRDRTAPDIGVAFNRTEPRPRTDWPVITPRELPAEKPSNASDPLHELQKDVLGLVETLASQKEGRQVVSGALTIAGALEFLKDKAQLLKQGA